MTTNDGPETITKRAAINDDGQKPPASAKKSKQSSLLAHFTKISSSQPIPSMHSSPVKKAPSDSNTSTDDLLRSEPISEGGQSIPSTSSEPAEKTGGAGPATGTRTAPSTATKKECRIVFSESERQLYRLELTQLGETWLAMTEGELKKPYFHRLKEFLAEEVRRGATIYPPSDLMYSWARLCPFPNTRVVLLGQDPYHNEGQAMGLCFSVPRGVAIPPSLLNIYKELSNDIEGFRPPRHGDLSSWARQGVLLLNTSLTVRAHEAASHAGKGWELFTDAVIHAVNVHRTNVVFLLWGNHAQRKSVMVDKRKHLVLTTVHPSPLSAARGFFGCKHFSKTNEYLVRHGQPPIDWKLPE